MWCGYMYHVSQIQLFEILNTKDYKSNNYIKIRDTKLCQRKLKLPALRLCEHRKFIENYVKYMEFTLEPASNCAGAHMGTNWNDTGIYDMRADHMCF